jgi:circadian clock protein KaiB
MRGKRAKDKASSPKVETVVVLRLYISGNAPNSVRAIANLEAICKQYLKDYKLEIVDVFEQPLRALADGVLVTPSLAKVSPAPVANVVGNLSDKRNVLLMLGVEGNVS